MNADYPPMQRVNRRRRCPICSRGDWCLFAKDGSAVICPRVSEGAVKRCGEAGWLHVLEDRPRSETRRKSRAIPLTARPRINFGKLAATYAAATDPLKLSELANGLGLSVESLSRLRVGWAAERGAWSFPMHGPDGHVLGIRLRAPDGQKFSVRGGREGVFWPHGLTFAGGPLLPEGPTDVAALLDLGFEAVGRPSCASGDSLLVGLVQRRRPPEVVVVADADVPGRRGAERLATTLLPYCPAVPLIRPPDGVKDVRQWKLAGATREDILAAIETAPVRRLLTQRRQA